MDVFDKRIFKFTTFIASLGDLIFHLPHLVRATVKKHVSKNFSEKIMLAVSTVNGCRYCTWFHARLALKAGADMSQVEDIMKMELGDNIENREYTALAFAQHYAESGRNPDKEAYNQFVEYYGKEEARDILLYIKMIYFGNLSGNTFDAFLSRFKGKPAEKSSVVFELFFFILSTPILLPQVWTVKRYEKDNPSLFGHHARRDT